MKYVALSILLLLAVGSVSAQAPFPEIDVLEQFEPLLDFDTPAMVWDEALPLGNGTLGALVWGDGKPLRISLDRTDLWDLRPVPEYHTAEYDYSVMRQWEKEGRFEDLIRLYDKPYERPAPSKIPAGRIEIIVPDGATFEGAELGARVPAAMVRFAGGSARVWVHATEPIGFIELKGIDPASVNLQAPAFGGSDVVTEKPGIVAGELTELGYAPPVITSGDTWQAWLQEGWGEFRFAACLLWEKDGDTWRGAWSIATNRAGAEPLKEAKRQAERALSKERRALAESHATWWKAYWEKSLIAIPDATIARQWYLDTYKFGAASRLGASPITLQGPWTADDGKLPPWKGDYHHDLNTELSYWSAYSGNRLEEGQNFVDWLWETRGACKEWTQRFFKMPGMNVPMTADLNNNQIGGWRQYTHSSTTACWLAHHFYLHYQFSGDENFLRERAYPYLRDCAIFIEAVTAEKGADGKRTLPLSSSPEINDNRPEAWFKGITNYDLSLMRWLLGATAELAEKAGEADDAVRWIAVRDELPTWSLGPEGTLLVAPGFPLPDSHRHFSHLMAIHPLGLIDGANGAEDERIIRASFAELEKLGTAWWTGYSFSWLANMAAREHDGEKAAKALETFATRFVLRNSFHANGDQTNSGISNFTYRPFTLEGNFAYAAGLQEMLLQSHSGVIEVFPAVPDAWKEIAFTTLRARGGWLVSASRDREGGQSVRVEATKDGVAKVQSWVDGAVIEIEMKAGAVAMLRADSGAAEVTVAGPK
jgi:alpha-L-fucosidase 2